MAVSVLAFLFVISISVLVHEFGHFVSARLCGVLVKEFSLGMGPPLLSWDRWGTRWSIRMVPIGGFVKLAGMEGDDEDGPGSFNTKGPLARALILSCGAILNVFLAFMLAATVLHFHGILNMESTEIGQVMPGYPAESLGLKAGDKIVEVNGITVSDWSQMASRIRREAPRGEIVIGVQSGGVNRYLHVRIPKDKEGHFLLGVRPAVKRLSWAESMAGAYRYSIDLAIGMLEGIWNWWFRLKPVDVSGPVGIAAAAGDVARRGAWELVAFIAAINLQLGLVNLLPFPALDGGRLIFVFLEVLFRRKIPEKYEGMVHYVGFALLVALMLWVTWKDIQRLIFQDR
ncbi:MAG: M50 family metallopeptidase [Thermanaerothrix sp.]|nr:M50 family metallopeptidase [Thermanaerothrix sp.]